jgi:hypothetical protein
MGKTAFTATSALAGLLISTAAFAGPSTQEGADKLVASFQTYLGTTPGVVTVSPTGEAYKVVIDTAPLAAKAGDGFSLKVSPIELMLTDRGDGTWDVAQDQPLSVDVQVPGTIDEKIALDRQAMTGTWDSTLMTFTTYKVSATNMVVEATTYPPAGTDAAVGPQTSRQTTEALEVTGTGVANPNGGADIRQTYDVKNIVQTMDVPTAPGGAPAQVTVTVPSYTGEMTGTGFRTAAIFDLMAYFVAHPGEAEIKGSQEDLRAMLTASLPLFENIAGSFELANLSAATPVGTFGAASAGVTLDMNGAVKDGKLREAFRFEGLTFPAGVVPDWALPLIPKTGSIDVAGTGFDAAAVAAKMIGAFDLTKTPPLPDTFGDELAPIALPTGQATITLAPGGVTGAEYAVTWEGAMQVGPGMPVPTGTAKVTLKGADAIRAALAAAPPDMGGPATMGLGAASAFAKFEADGTLTWEIDATEPGVLKVNGRPIPMGAQ